MLVNITRIEPEESMKTILEDIGGSDPMPSQIDTGQYLCYHWNFHNCVAEKLEQYPDLGDFSEYGVCDSPDQFLEKYKKLLDDPNRKFVVSFTNIRKSKQTERNWRWHKWGPYIGEQEPTCEYLFDEPVIEEVFTYHIYELECHG
jgi:hypothetical protein